MDQKQEDPSERCLADEFIANLQGADDRARDYLTLGCVSEGEKDWDSAIANYRLALAAVPTNAFLQYFSNNNLGFSLIQQGWFAEAEGYCIAAIEIDPSRHNAHKNLGLVRQGQGRLLDAAFCFVSAYRLRPGDERALSHLEQLVTANPQLLMCSDRLRQEFAFLSGATDGSGCRHVH